MTSASALLLAAVTVGTWNGQWFPSGRAEHRASEAEEAATIRAAGEMLKKGFDRMDPAGTNDIILCLNEIRGPKAARSLCEATGRTNLNIAVITAYRRRDRFDMQQDAIATTLPVASASWSRWKNAKAQTPPRGYAAAKIILSPSSTATVYSVHLKSNYGQTTEHIARLNRSKRALAAMQLAEMERPKRGKPRQPVIIAGDFNTDKWSEKFKADTVFSTLEGAGFANVLEILPPALRATHPGKGKWSDSALDYIMLRDIEPSGLPAIIPAAGISDHDAVMVVID